MTTTLAWLSDLHLDAATQERKQRFFQQMRKSPADAFLITGDISKADMLPQHLRELGQIGKWKENNPHLGKSRLLWRFILPR